MSRSVMNMKTSGPVYFDGSVITANFQHAKSDVIFKDTGKGDRHLDSFETDDSDLDEQDGYDFQWRIEAQAGIC